MDLDGDKIADLISGSYTGGVTFYKGQGGGKYAAATQILPKNVKYDVGELALSPCGGDWDGDGDVDLAVGQISGPVRLLDNDGKGAFTRKGNFTSEGKEIQAGDGGPCLTDWNGDGLLDLLLGDDTGNVVLYPGLAKGSLELGKRQFLLPAQSADAGWKPARTDPKSPTGLTVRRPGVRTKPFAADWNGDGKLDLLVGDFLQVSGPAKKLTPAQQKRLAQLNKDLDALSRKMMELYARAEKLAMQDVGLKERPKPGSEAEVNFQNALQARYMKLRDADRTPQGKQMALIAEIEKLEPRADATGRVWVYLRK